LLRWGWRGAHDLFEPPLGRNEKSQSEMRDEPAVHDRVIDRRAAALPPPLGTPTHLGPQERNAHGRAPRRVSIDSRL
jgi:hypothetical protein